MNQNPTDSNKYCAGGHLIDLILCGAELSDGSSQRKNNQNAEGQEAYQPGFRQKFQLQIVGIARPSIGQVQETAHEATKISKARAECR
jgi:hypothetical protein